MIVNDKTMRKLSAFVLAVLLSVSLAIPQGYVFAAGTGSEAGIVSESAQSYTTSITGIRRGTVSLDLPEEDVEGFRSIFKAGDVVTVTIENSDPATVVTLPFIEGRSGVGFRRSALSLSTRGNTAPGNTAPGNTAPNNAASLSLRMSDGSFADTYGITEDQIGAKVVISMEEPGGYLDEYNAWQIGSLSSERSDFPELSDEEFANYRCVTTTGMKEGVLYRSSSPIDPMIKRNKIVDEANRKNQVTTIINLNGDSESAMKKEGYDESYYVTVNHFEADMQTDFGSETFNSKLAECLRFMIAHPGVFEVNCIFGKDRTGFTIAVLEGLVGAGYDELVSDYVATYPHYYPAYNDYQPVSERDRVIAEGNLVAQMEYAYGVDDLKNADIKSATENYLRAIGLSDEEIEALRNCLADDRVDIGLAEAGSVTYSGKLSGPAVTYDGRVLEEGTDYTWEKADESRNYTDAGRYTAILTGKGVFKGTAEVQYEIAPKTAAPIVKLSKTAYTYNGKAQKPAVKVSDGSTVLDASDYTVTYASGRKNVGTYRVSVKLKGNYKGSGAASFRICPKGTKIKSFKKGRGSLKVRWKKQTEKMSSSRISGYQIQLATDSNFSKNKKTVNVKGCSRSSKWVKKLKSGKKYYARIRTYKTLNGKKYYSAWSKTVTVKTRKI